MRFPPGALSVVLLSTCAVARISSSRDWSRSAGSQRRTAARCFANRSRSAHALVTRKELSADWLSGATGSLPERRLTARLLERAAREAGARLRRGDGAAASTFAAVYVNTHDPSADALVRAWHELLADRETL